jgi:hypothetical protein
MLDGKDLQVWSGPRHVVSLTHEVE